MAIAVYNPLDHEVSGEFAGYTKPGKPRIAVAAQGLDFVADEIAAAWQSPDRWGGRPCPLYFGDQAVAKYKEALGLPADDPKTRPPARVPEKPAGGSPADTGVVYACPVPNCDRTFGSRPALQGHLRVHKKETPDLDVKDLLARVKPHVLNPTPLPPA